MDRARPSETAARGRILVTCFVIGTTRRGAAPTSELDRSSKSPDGVVAFVEYAVQGFVDGLREPLDFIRKEQWEVTWEIDFHEHFQGKDTPACNRQKPLVLDMSEAPTLRKDLPRESPGVAAEYAGKGEKTLTRDLNALLEMKLIARKGKGGLPS